MFGIGMSEMLIICAVALLVFGPTELPQIAKKIARGLKEVRKASDDLRKSIDLDDDDEPPRRKPPPPLHRDERDDRELPPSITGSVLTADTLANAEADVAPVVAVSAGSAARVDDGEGMPVLRSAQPLAVSKHFNDDDDGAGEPVTAAVVTTTTEPTRG